MHLWTFSIIGFFLDDRDDLAHEVPIASIAINNAISDARGAVNVWLVLLIVAIFSPLVFRVRLLVRAEAEARA